MKVAARIMLMLSVVLTLGAAGCGGAKTGGGGTASKTSGGARKGKVSEEDKARLDEAKVAAEESEKKLSELRQERIKLESGDAGASEAAAE
jgi:hypothetical protein